MIIFLASSVSAAGIESAEIAPNPVGRGDLFTMTIILDHSSSSDVEFPLKEQPEQLLLWRGPYIRSFIDSGKNGESRRKVRITTTFKAQRSGRMIIPELSVIVGGVLYKTEPKLLRVGLYKSRKLYIPLEVEWRSAFEDIYAGEAVPLFLMVKNQEVVSLFDQTRVAIPRDGFFERAVGLGDINQLGFGGIVLYDIPAASYIYTSPVPGAVKIPAAGVDGDGITGWTADLHLQIKPVPTQISATGAIGNFDYSVELNSREVSVGDELILSVEVVGTGNLNYLKIPEPEITGGFLVSREEIDDYSQSIFGYSGSKSVVWTYNSTSSGDINIKMPGFSFLNKDSGVIETFPERTRQVTVSEAQVKSVQAVVETVTFSVIDDEAGLVHEWQNYYKEKTSYIWLFPSGVFFLLTRLLKGRRTFIALILTVIIMVAGVSLIGSISGRLDSGSENTVVSSVYYNTAVGLYNDGNLPASLHNFRTAVYLQPMSRLYLESLEYVEEQTEDFSSIPPSVRLHPDLFFFLLAAAVNLFFLIAFIRSNKPGGAVSVVFIMLMFAVIVFSGFLFYTHLVRQPLTGIVSGENTSIKKIPRESAEDWLPLSPGISARILDESGNYKLIETGMGVKGWIEQSYIIEDRP
jgi:hypothetical protein